MQADAIIHQLGNHLREGDQLSGQECPYCERLGSGEKSLSITRKATAIVYKCHRAKCGREGFVRAEGASMFGAEVAGANRYARYLRTSIPLFEKQKHQLTTMWGFDDFHFRKSGAEYTLACDRVVLPIYNREGDAVGATLRAVGKSGGPKSMICMVKTDWPCMSFYEGEANASTIIIVEDQASAIRASRYCSSVALIGVYMDSVKAREIAKTDKKTAIFCLDKDAFQKTIKLANTYGSMFEKHKAVCPPRDLKDMGEQELREYLADACNLEVEYAT